MKSNIVVRMFENNKIYVVNAKFSSAFLKEFKQIISSLPDNYYVLCPLYEDRTGYDFQLGVSGTVKKYESFFKAVKREVGEEIGLLIPTHEITDTNINRFMYNIKDLYDVPLDYDNVLINNQPDTFPKKKILCIVYGLEIDIDQYLTQKNIYRYANDDQIIGVGKMKVQDIYI
jgi:hypothetical protein